MPGSEGLVLSPEKGRGSSQRRNQKAQGGRASLPKSEFYSEAHIGGPGMRGDPRRVDASCEMWLLLVLRSWLVRPEMQCEEPR